MTPPTIGFQVQTEGFHSAEDARRMQQMAQAMLADRRHLALTSPDPELLADYSRLLVRDLRRDPRIKVLPHLPSTSEYLLDHINGLLADIPIDQVLDRDVAARRPVQVLVVPDTPQLTAEGLTLLVRLVNDLPGANLRLVLVQGRDLAVTESLRALGPQLLHWSILPPGMTAAQAAQAAQAREALREAIQAGPKGDITVPDLAPREGRGKRSARTAGRQQPEGRASTADLGWAGMAMPSWAGQAAPALIARTDSPAARAPRPRPLGNAATTQSPAAPAARRNWALLTGGLALSAALAVALGVWISTHTPAPRPMAAAGQTAAPLR